MGHILSFPLLCLINRSASCVAIPRERFMRINGDDVLFPASATEYALWKAKTACVGLKFSLGKNYYTRDLALINSRFFTWSKTEHRWMPMKVPNLGLLGYQYELVDRETGVQVLPWDQYGAMWNAFEKTLPPSMWKVGRTIFAKRYPMLANFPGPLVGPRELGCLGGRVPTGYQFTRRERMWMEAHRQGKFSFREGVMSDYSRIQTVFHEKLTSWINTVGADYSFGVTHHDNVGPPESVFPDPYQRGGGFAEKVMTLRRWLVKPTSLQKAVIFGARRWNKFLLRTGFNQPLGGEALNSVLDNCYSHSVQYWHSEWTYRDKGYVGLDDIHLLFRGA